MGRAAGAYQGLRWGPFRFEGQVNRNSLRSPELVPWLVVAGNPEEREHIAGEPLGALPKAALIPIPAAVAFLAMSKKMSESEGRA